MSIANAPSKAPPEVNQRFTPADLEQMKPYGVIRSHAPGTVLFQEGDTETDCCVVLSGQLDVYMYDRGEEKRVGWLEPGQFVGDGALLSGRAAIVQARMAEAGEVLHIPRADFQRLLARESRLSDLFVNSILARQAWIRSTGRTSVTVVGSPYSRDCFMVRDLLQRHSIPFHWLDVDANPELLSALQAKGITPEDLPAVFRGPQFRLLKPSQAQLVEAFGLDLLADNACADVIVVGAGPGGLAASVYAASEGLSVLTLDAEGPGGQAGTSSKIENYLGFPTGLSGRELAERALLQAEKFGARIAGPVSVVNLERDGKDYCLRLSDGRCLGARAVVIASGMQYRRLPLANLEQFEGRGVYYGATPMEAQLTAGAKVAIVGAGNSAGQGAAFLAQTAAEVHVLYRRANIRDTMSEYLAHRLEGLPNVFLHPETEITALKGCEERLRKIACRVGRDGERVLETPFVFLFIGAKPCTEWLPASLAKDEAGFVKTGAALAPRELVKAGWALERMPSLFETSWERVYAVGDVRSGSVKRVASAVGEGSVCVQFIHQALGASSA